MSDWPVRGADDQSGKLRVQQHHLCIQKTGVSECNLTSCTQEALGEPRRPTIEFFDVAAAASIILEGEKDSRNYSVPEGFPGNWDRLQKSPTCQTSVADKCLAKAVLGLVFVFAKPYGKEKRSFSHWTGLSAHA